MSKAHEIENETIDKVYKLGHLAEQYELLVAGLQAEVRRMRRTPDVEMNYSQVAQRLEWIIQTVQT